MERRLYRHTLAVWAFLLAIGAARAGLDVPISENLQRDGALARAQGLPILLSVSAEDCPYCDQLEEDFLGPMLISGEYTDKVIIRRLMVDGGSQVIDFDGRQQDAGYIANRFRARLTPTILFLDGNGREVAGRIVGINTPEMFGGYLDTCIEMALLRIRDPDNTVVFAGCDPPETR